MAATAGAGAGAGAGVDAEVVTVMTDSADMWGQVVAQLTDDEGGSDTRESEETRPAKRARKDSYSSADFSQNTPTHQALGVVVEKQKQATRRAMEKVITPPHVHGMRVKKKKKKKPKAVKRARPTFKARPVDPDGADGKLEDEEEEEEGAAAGMPMTAARQIALAALDGDFGGVGGGSGGGGEDGSGGVPVAGSGGGDPPLPPLPSADVGEESLAPLNADLRTYNRVPYDADADDSILGAEIPLHDLPWPQFCFRCMVEVDKDDTDSMGLMETLNKLMRMRGDPRMRIDRVSEFYKTQIQPNIEFPPGTRYADNLARYGTRYTDWHPQMIWKCMMGEHTSNPEQLTLNNIDVLNSMIADLKPVMSTVKRMADGSTVRRPNVLVHKLMLAELNARDRQTARYQSYAAGRGNR